MDRALDNLRGTETVEVRRRFDASPEEVFRAWVTPRLIEQWWGPEGFRTTVASLDLRVGGAFRFDMLSPTGSRGATAGIYREIDPPRRLVFDATEHCNCDLPSGEMPQLDPARVIVAFVGRGAGTEVTVTHAGLSSAAIGLRVDGGWSSSLGRLAAVLSF